MGEHGGGAMEMVQGWRVQFDEQLRMARELSSMDLDQVHKSIDSKVGQAAFDLALQQQKEGMVAELKGFLADDTARLKGQVDVVSQSLSNRIDSLQAQVDKLLAGAARAPSSAPPAAPAGAAGPSPSKAGAATPPRAEDAGGGADSREVAAAGTRDISAADSLPTALPVEAAAAAAGASPGAGGGQTTGPDAAPEGAAAGAAAAALKGPAAGATPEAPGTPSEGGAPPAPWSALQAALAEESREGRSSQDDELLQRLAQRVQSLEEAFAKSTADAAAASLAARASPAAVASPSPGAGPVRGVAGAAPSAMDGAAAAAAPRAGAPAAGSTAGSTSGEATPASAAQEAVGPASAAAAAAAAAENSASGGAGSAGAEMDGGAASCPSAGAATASGGGQEGAGSVAGGLSDAGGSDAGAARAGAEPSEAAPAAAPALGGGGMPPSSKAKREGETGKSVRHIGVMAKVRDTKVAEVQVSPPEPAPAAAAETVPPTSAEDPLGPAGAAAPPAASKEPAALAGSPTPVTVVKMVAAPAAGLSPADAEAMRRLERRLDVLESAPTTSELRRLQQRVDSLEASALEVLEKASPGANGRAVASGGESGAVPLASLMELQADLQRLKTRFDYMERCVPPDVQKALRYFEPHGSSGYPPVPADTTDGAAGSLVSQQVSEAKSGAEDAMREVTNLSRAMRGLQREVDTNGSKLHDVTKAQGLLRTRLESVLPKMLQAVQMLTQKVGLPSEGEAGWDESQASLRSLLLELGAESSPDASSVSQGALQEALASMHKEMQDRIERLRQDLSNSLGGKAEAAQLKTLILRFDSLAQHQQQQHQLQVQHQIILSQAQKGDDAAIVRLPMRCLSCDKNVAMQPLPPNPIPSNASAGGRGVRRALSPLPQSPGINGSLGGAVGGGGGVGGRAASAGGGGVPRSHSAAALPRG